MGVDHVGLEFPDEGFEALFGGADQPPFVEAGRARWWHRTAVEIEAIDLFVGRCAVALLGRREVEGLPAEGALLPQDRRGAEGVAAVQGNGVVEDVEDAHLEAHLGRAGRRRGGVAVTQEGFEHQGGPQRGTVVAGARLVGIDQMLQVIAEVRQYCVGRRKNGRILATKTNGRNTERPANEERTKQPDNVEGGRSQQ